MKGFSLLIGFLLLSLVPAHANDYFRPGPDVTTHVVILAGASVDPEYAGQIRNWGLRLYDTLTGEYGYRPGSITLLLGGAPDPAETRISGPCRAEEVQAGIDDLKKRLKPGDRVFFFLLGHGTYDGQTPRFVIHGPDLTAERFATMLATLSEQDLVVINTTSAGFPFCKLIAEPGRVVVCATRSGVEIYNTVFAEHFINALAGRAGDRDKNRRVSMLEAFWFAGKGVKKWYADQNRIPSEHAVLDDNGDGYFSFNPQPADGDGQLAQIAYLELLPHRLAARLPPGTDTMRYNRLVARVRDLERSVILLRSAKAEMEPATYQARLEELLIELARSAKKVRQLSDSAGS